MRYDIFSTPIFIDTIDLDKIDIGNPPTEKIWLSQTPSTLGQDHTVSEETVNYLAEVISNNLVANLIGDNPRFGEIWRNKYQEHDWQDIHIHPHSSWSFVIYETVDSSKTVFMSPIFKDIQNHLGTNLSDFPLDFRPQLKKGDIIIFPSYLEHFVMAGNVGSTISGNIYMDYM